MPDMNEASSAVRANPSSPDGQYLLIIVITTES